MKKDIYCLKEIESYISMAEKYFFKKKLSRFKSNLFVLGVYEEADKMQHVEHAFYESQKHDH